MWVMDDRRFSKKEKKIVDKSRMLRMINWWCQREGEVSAIARKSVGSEEIAKIVCSMQFCVGFKVLPQDPIGALPLDPAGGVAP